MTMKKTETWAVLFDLDETLVLTSAIEGLRKNRKWREAEAAFSRTALPEGTLAFLENLSQKAVLGVVTKSPRSYAEKLLAYHDIDIPVLAAYHDVKNVKPHPEALLLAAQKVGIEPSTCIYVGDDANDVQAAKAARFTPLGICWGAPTNIGLSSVCASWDEVYDEIVGLISS